MSDIIVNAASPSTIPNSDSIIVSAIKNSSKTTPIILHITLQGDDFDANARPLGGGVRGAITACMLLPETSCQNWNRFLDRAMLRGDINDEFKSFFDFE